METLKINYDVHINFYMRIHDAQLFGGKGSIGYLHQCMEHCHAFKPEKIETAAQEVLNYVSKAFEVFPDKIEFISYQEYKDATADEEDEDYENACSDK